MSSSTSTTIINIFSHLLILIMKPVLICPEKSNVGVVRLILLIYLNFSVSVISFNKQSKVCRCHQDCDKKQFTRLKSWYKPALKIWPIL